MTKTLIPQLTQLASSRTYNDQLSSGSNLVSGSTNLENDLNSIRSQLRRVLWGESTGSWYDGITTQAGNQFPVGLNDVARNVFSTKNSILMKRMNNENLVFVASGSNFALLSTSLGTVHSDVISINDSQTTGTVAFQLPVSQYGSFNLGLISGSHFGSPPKNLVLIKDAYTNRHITTSENKTIFGLLQVENSASSGDVFNDTNRRSQLSFVVNSLNNNTSSFTSAPTSSIGGRILKYAYPRRMYAPTLQEDSLLLDVPYYDFTTSSFGSVVQGPSGSQGPPGDNLTIDYVSGFVADVGTAANRRGFTYGYDPLSGSANFTAIAVISSYDSTFVSGQQMIFGTMSDNGNPTTSGWAILRSGGTLYIRYRDTNGSTREGTFFNSLSIGKWAVVHLRVVNNGGFLSAQLFVNGGQAVEIFQPSSGSYVSGSNLCLGVCNEGTVLPAYRGYIHGAAYVTGAMSPAEIAAHAEACIEAGQLVQATTGTQLTDGWRVSVNTNNPDATNWDSFLGGRALTTLNSVALPSASKAPPILWM